MSRLTFQYEDKAINTTIVFQTDSREAATEYLEQVILRGKPNPFRLTRVYRGIKRVPLKKVP